MKKLEKEKIQKILSMLDLGETSSTIALKLKIHPITVRRIQRNYRPNIPRNRGGRPLKLTRSTKRFINRLILTGKANTATQVANQLRTESNMHVSPDTIRRALKQSGLRAVVKKKKPRLLPKHKKARLDFARKYESWTVEDWNKVIWSDEHKINRLGSDGRQWVWKKRDNGLADQQVTGTVKFGGGHLMIWGCMTSQGVGYACKIDDTMDATLYVNILSDELMDTLQYYGMEKEEVIFQQDNDPKHKSRLATEWFQENEITALDWPAQSPDLNPIEHLWKSLNHQLAGYEEEPKSMAELWERVQEQWDKIPVSVCTNLIESMPKRIAAVLKAKGGYTKY